MSSFARYCEVVRDGREPTGRRVLALGHAVQRYASLTRTSYQSVFTALAMRCALWRGRPDMDEPLRAAALELARARNAFLEHQRTVVAERRLSKRAGRRLPRANWEQDLRSAALLGQPLSANRGTLNSRGALDGFLGTFMSRYSCFDGYWLFGFLVSELAELQLDLLDQTLRAPTTPLETAKALAGAKFRDQLAKRSLSPTGLSSARLVLTRGKPSAELSGDRVRSGYVVNFDCRVVDQGGRQFQLARSAFVAPHDPQCERRSAR